MIRRWRMLRVQLAVVGFAAIYLPVMVLFTVTSVTEDETVDTLDGVVVADGTTTTERSPWVLWTAVALAPAAAGLAWWWAGRAVGPIDRVRLVAEDIEGSDLSRRIALDRGPTEVVALAASFDAMLDRLQAAAETQQQLVEETSHELRTPLAALMTNADVLLAHPSPTPEVYREGLGRSKDAAQRMLVTIEELLLHARARARTIDRSPADLVVVVREVVAEAEVLAASRSVDLSLTYRPRQRRPTAAAPIDRAAVRRAVANLVDNAVKYAPGGSSVEVVVETSPADVTVVVTDHGPGIPEDQQAHIFDRFWRGTADTPGSGLGLPIAHQVAQAHGGSLAVTSPGPSGDGTEFRLRLRRGDAAG